MEYRLTIMIANHGASDEAAEACLDALLKLYPETGPVVSQNVATGCLSLTVAVDATDPWAASNMGSHIFSESLNAAQLPLAPIVGVNVHVVDAGDYSSEDVRELVSA